MRRTMVPALAGLVVLAGCGRDFVLPEASADEGPHELGGLAGYFQLSVKEMASFDGTSREFPISIPVAGLAVAQHLILPDALRDEAGGNPLVLFLSEPGGIDFSNTLTMDGSRIRLLFGAESSGGRVSGTAFARAEPPTQFELHPAPGAGVARLEFGGCPGRPLFTGDRTLNLQRICRFEASRSGVYAGCEATCDAACDPETAPEVHYHAIGFTPLARLPYDFVTAVSYWRSDAGTWVPNFSLGGYDRFFSRGSLLMRRIDESRFHPASLSLSSNADLLEVDWRLGPQLSDPAPPEGWTCEGRSIVRRAVGGQESFCDPPESEVRLRIEARRVASKVLVDVVFGDDARFRSIDLQLIFGAWAKAIGLTWGVGHGASDLLQVIARAEPEGRPLPASRSCAAADFCFDIPGDASAAAGISIEAMVRFSGVWKLCPGFPAQPECDAAARVDRQIKVPVAAALPVCVAP